MSIHNSREILRSRNGYIDSTASTVITKVDLERMEDEDRFRNLLDTIEYIADLAGFDIENRIILKDRKTGKVWK